MKIAFVVQRYGEEVNGGAELLCRWVAEHLSDEIDIEVLTTCAKDYVTWKDEYAPGSQELNGVMIRRFPVDKERDIKKFNRLSESIYGRSNVAEKEELDWIYEQGPQCSKLLDFIRDNQEDYDLFVFYTYLYFPTVMGLPLVAKKSVLVPAAHDEAPIKLRVYSKLFNLPKALIYSTHEEKKFVNDFFNNERIMDDVIGTGVNLPNQEIVAQDFVEKYDLDNFILYAGRLEEAKGLKQLIDYFSDYIKASNKELNLVLLGKGPMKIEQHPNIKPLGYVSEQDKFNAMAAAKLIIVPSELESLSIISLEAWLLKKPVLVNGGSPVLRDNCLRSNGGLYYKDYNEFSACLSRLLKDKSLQSELGLNGFNYVKENYDWSVIKRKYITLLQSLTAS